MLSGPSEKSTSPFFLSARKSEREVFSCLQARVSSLKPRCLIKERPNRASISRGVVGGMLRIDDSRAHPPPGCRRPSGESCTRPPSHSGIPLPARRLPPPRIHCSQTLRSHWLSRQWYSVHAERPAWASTTRTLRRPLRGRRGRTSLSGLGQSSSPHAKMTTNVSMFALTYKYNQTRSAKDLAAASVTTACLRDTARHISHPLSIGLAPWAWKRTFNSL